MVLYINPAKRHERADETSALTKARCCRKRPLVYNRHVLVIVSMLASTVKKIYSAKHVLLANELPIRVRYVLPSRTAAIAWID